MVGIFLFTILLVLIYFVGLIVGFKMVFIGVDVLSLICWTAVPMFFLLVIIYGKELAKQPADRIMVDCISQYYTVSQDTEYFEDFKWMIDVKGAVVIEYNWDRWLVIPNNEYIYLLSPSGNDDFDFPYDIDAKCKDLHIGYRMVSFHTWLYRYAGHTSFKFKGRSVIFQKITCDLDWSYYKLYKDSIKSYKNVCYICFTKDMCNIAKMAIDAIKRRHMVCGVSLGGLYTHRYLGVCAKTPKSREEFDTLLSFAAELKEMLKCEENS